MKRHLLTILFTIAAAVPLFTACLDEEPKDQIDESHIYTTASDIYVNAVASLYNHIGSNTESEGLQGTCRGIFDYNTFTTDEVMNPVRGGDWYDGGLWENLYNHRWTAADTYLYDVWKYLYKVIALSNHSLAVIDSHADILTPAQRRAYGAEVRAVRALFHYYAMDFFGRVPLVTADSLSVGDITQHSRSDVFAFVVSELQEAAPLLPDAHSNLEGSYYGRITRPVANFLLAKLMLNAEVYSDDDWTDGERPDGSAIFFNVDGENLNAWQACRHYCDLVEQAGYTLADDYASNFSTHNETSVENIFTIPMDKELYTAEYHYLFRSLHYKHGGVYSRASENGTCATLATMKAFGYATDSADTRLAACLYTDTVTVDGEVIMLDNGEPLVYQPLEVLMNLTFSPYVRTAGARIAKYEMDRTAYADGKLPSNDIVLYRYADVLLMRAEAALRAGDDASADLNAVRRRAAMPAVTPTLDAVLRERSVELFFEGWRRQDLVRFDRFHRAYDLRTPDAAEADRHTIVFPIPQKAIDLNAGLSQNPGY